MLGYGGSRDHALCARMCRELRASYQHVSSLYPLSAKKMIGSPGSRLTVRVGSTRARAEAKDIPTGIPFFPPSRTRPAMVGSMRARAQKALARQRLLLLCSAPRARGRNSQENLRI